MNKLGKVVVSPDGDVWKIEILDEAGGVFHIRYEDTYEDAMAYGYRQGTLYQLKVESLH